MPGIVNSHRFGGGGPSLTARYWQFLPLAWPDTTGPIQVGEIGLAASSGGTNLCAGGTASASHGTAANAFDGTAATGWQANPDNAQTPGALWLKYDCGGLVTASHFFVHAGSNGDEGKRAAPVWLVRNSEDGIAYSPIMVVEFSGGVFSNGERRDVALAVADFEDVEANARGWEYVVSSPSSGEGWHRECEFGAIYGGSSIGAQGNYAYTTNPYIYAADNGLPRRMFDGNTGSLFVNLFNSRVGFVRAAPVGAMEEMRFNPEGGAQPGALAVRWTVDGITWNTKKSFSGITGWSNGTFKSFDLR